MGDDSKDQKNMMPLTFDLKVNIVCRSQDPEPAFAFEHFTNLEKLKPNGKSQGHPSFE